MTAPERVYRDDWPKPEIMVALTQFRSLAGFRSCLDTAELFDELGAGPEAQFIPATLRNNRDDSLKDLFLAFLQPNSVNAAALDGVLHAAETRSGLDGPLGEFSRLALELRITFPGDRGLLCALLLNQVTLEPGEALYIDAGTIHAHLSGTGVEVMASSDNVVRGGLTDKHVDIPELSRIGHFVASTPDVTRGSEVADGVFDYETHCAEFDVWRLELPEPPVMVPGQCFPRIVLVTNGTATLFGNGPPLALEPGMAAFLPAGASAHVTGEGQMFVASPGAPGQ